MKRGYKLLFSLALGLGVLFGFNKLAFAEDNVIQIATKEDFSLIYENPDGNYELVSNIMLGTDFTAIDSFGGTFDGNGHVIYGLKLGTPSGDEGVAFVITNEGTIEDVGFVDANVVGRDESVDDCAAVIAVNNKGTISGCFVEDSLVSGAHRSAAICANNIGTVINCYSNAKITAGAEAGGLVALNGSKIETEAGKIINSYSFGRVASLSRNAGGVSAYGYSNSTIEGCAYFGESITTDVDGSSGRILGKAKGTPKLINNIANQDVLIDKAKVTGALNDKNGWDVARGYFDKAGIFAGKLDWDFSKAWYFDTASSRPKLREFEKISSSRVFGIGSVNDLMQIGEDWVLPTDKFFLLNDIEVNYEDENGKLFPIDTFNATLDGNGHNIIGFKYESDSDRRSALIRVNNGTVKNLGLTNALIKGASAESGVKDYDYYAAGIAGTNNGVIEKCFVTGNINRATRVAGIAGENNNLIIDCYYVGSANGKAETAGICAMLNKKAGIKNCYTKSVVSTKGSNVGGISGYAYTGSFINDCVTLTGHVIKEKKGDIGRILAKANGHPTLDNNYASENVYGGDTVLRAKGEQELEVIKLAEIANERLKEQGLTEGLVTITQEQRDQAAEDSKNDHADLQGQRISLDKINLGLFKDTLKWDLNDVWAYDDTLKRPVLKGMEEAYSVSYIPETVSTNDIDYSYLDKGISYANFAFTDNNSNNQKISIIKMNYKEANEKYEIIVGVKDDMIPAIDENGNYVRNSDAEDHDLIKGIIPEQMWTTEKARGVRVIAGINGEFYTKEGPEGYMIKDGSEIINGTRISSDKIKYPFHGFFGVTKEESNLPPFVIGTYDEDWNKYKGSLLQATGGQFILNEGNNIPDYDDLIECIEGEKDYDQETFYRYKNRHPRTAMGIDKDNNVYMVVVDGRQGEYAAGMLIDELGELMKLLGCTVSINMDGGGSSTAVAHLPIHVEEPIEGDGGENYEEYVPIFHLMNHPNNTNKDNPYYGDLRLRKVFSSVLIAERKPAITGFQAVTIPEEGTTVSGQSETTATIVSDSIGTGDVSENEETVSGND